jgi:putative endonuclease
MSNNTELGREGENVAAEYLAGKGYAILERNFRRGRTEIDLVAAKGDLLVFVEVKTRRTAEYGWPEEAVSEQKADNIRSAAESYMELHDWNADVRYDIIAIVNEGEKPQIEHLEDAF